jgi:glycosyltransferase involved in cell wall biosynthesis
MSLDEASANSYIEALASGLPIVTHDRDVTRWTIGETGLLVDAADPEAVAGGLARALGRRTPEEIQARHDRVLARFSWSRIAGEYHDFFLEILGKEGSGGAS